MSLKVIHFLVFVITSLMSFVCAAVTWGHHVDPEMDGQNYLLMTIGFAIAGACLMGYAIWYINHAKKIIT